MAAFSLFSTFLFLFPFCCASCYIYFSGFITDSWHILFNFIIDCLHYQVFTLFNVKCIFYTVGVGKHIVIVIIVYNFASFFLFSVHTYLRTYIYHSICVSNLFHLCLLNKLKQNAFCLFQKRFKQNFFGIIYVLTPFKHVRYLCAKYTPVAFSSFLFYVRT